MSSGRSESKTIYLEDFFQQRLNFSPFISSVYGLLYVDAGATLKRITIYLPKKWQEPYARTCRYVKSSIYITLVQATHRCIWGPGWRHIGWAYTARSQRTVLDQASTNRHTGKNPILERSSPQVTLNRFWSWRPKPTQYVRIEHQQAACWTESTKLGTGQATYDRQGGSRFTCPPYKIQKLTQYNSMYFNSKSLSSSIVLYTYDIYN